VTEPTDHDTTSTPEATPTADAGPTDRPQTDRRRTRRRGGRGRGGGQRDTTSDPAGGSADSDAASGSGRDQGGDTRPASTATEEPPAADERPSGGDDGGGGGDGGDGGGSEGGRRRRRRGRRGRGRGRGGAGGGGGAAEAGPDADGAGTDGGDDGKHADASKRDAEGGGAERARSGGEAGRAQRATKGESAKGDTRGDAKGESAKGDAKGDEKPDGGKGGRSKGDADAKADDADREVAEAIAKGGTRMAAKSGRNRRGGGGSGGGKRQQRPGGVPEEVRRAILEGPPRTMLVTNREDRTQIAVLEDRTVVEHYVTRKKDVTFVGNIYMARVQNVLPGMEAAFLDIGKGRNGVLYAGEVLYDELDLEEGADERIENVLKPGQKVLVQVTKDPMGSKGPRLTMHLSLAGRYSVLAPSSELFGISRKLTDRERDRLRRIVKKVKPDEHGVIVRTAAENASEEQLTADLERLLGKWAKVEEAAQEAKALTAVYEEPPLVVKVIRDNFGPEFERCIVDDEDLYHQVRGYLDEVAPELTAKVELYGQPTADARARAAGAPALEDASADPGTADQAAVEPAAGDATTEEGTDAPAIAEGEEAAAAPVDTDAASKADTAVVPAVVDLEAARTRRETLPRLFDAYDVTDQLRKATGKKVWLPSGGYLIIETTEAMKVIDVNSGKFTGNGDMNLEEVVLRTNLEAADEIVRQLRLRDMGGIIVIDFIDMLLKANQEQVVRRLKRELLRDRTKTRVSEVSRLGLVQMTRKNVSQGLVEAFSHTCEHCEGRGYINELD
jgi:Ribonuclease G/E